MQEASTILIRPMLTEKSTKMTESCNQVSFEVADWANKHQVKSAVESHFGVRVLSVRTQMNHGKTKRRRQSVCKFSNWKKAIVHLADGHKIDFFAGE